MNISSFWRVASVAAILGSPAAMAQDDLIDYLVTECESDIANFCSQVTHNRGIILPLLHSTNL